MRPYFLVQERSVQDFVDMFPNHPPTQFLRQQGNQTSRVRRAISLEYLDSKKALGETPLMSLWAGWTGVTQLAAHGAASSE